MKVGLVLSGGGAKGAYQVGMLKAFGDMGGQVDAVAGASIGALNGAVIACSLSVEDAVERLQKLWMDEVPYCSLIASALAERGREFMRDRLEMLASLLDEGSSPTSIRELLAFLDERFFSLAPIRELLDEYVDVAALDDGLPLYVSIYKSQGALLDVLRCAVAELGIVNTKRSEFEHIQGLSNEERIECLLASAALPAFFPAHKVKGSRYSDGGQGGWWMQQGNTPVEPLVVDEHCDHVIVLHAGEGSLWSRDEYPNATVLEVRPTQAPSRFPIKDLLERDERVIASWIEQGYNDGKRTFRRVKEAVESRNELRLSKGALAVAQQRVRASERNRERAEAHLASILADL